MTDVSADCRLSLPDYVGQLIVLVRKSYGCRCCHCVLLVLVYQRTESTECIDIPFPRPPIWNHIKVRAAVRNSQTLTREIIQHTNTKQDIHSRLTNWQWPTYRNSTENIMWFVFFTFQDARRLRKKFAFGAMLILCVWRMTSPYDVFFLLRHLNWRENWFATIAGKTCKNKIIRWVAASSVTATRHDKLSQCYNKA